MTIPIEKEDVDQAVKNQDLCIEMITGMLRTLGEWQQKQLFDLCRDYQEVCDYALERLDGAILKHEFPGAIGDAIAQLQLGDDITAREYLAKVRFEIDEEEELHSLEGNKLERKIDRAVEETPWDFFKKIYEDIFVKPHRTNLISEDDNMEARR